MDSFDNNGREEERDDAPPSRNNKWSNSKVNAGDFLSRELTKRAEQCPERLRQHLLGTILVRLRDNGGQFYFQWTSNKFSFSTQEPSAPDCTIELSGRDMLKIADGDLNAQVAMLSDKVRVQGKPSLAIYFFNLVSD